MILSKPNHIKIYGHRGARGDLPENTLESFKYLFDNAINAYETDILISKDIKTTLKKWISEFSNKNKNKKTFKNCLFLYGPPGVGKTTIANLILKEFNYDIIEFNSSNFRTQKLIREKINDILGKRNILNLLNNNKKEIAIITTRIPLRITLFIA